MKEYRSSLDSFLQYIPTWVKVAVALALGLGTMVGWKRIVVTVGERIGKHHMTYGQGMSAELVAMSTIAAADGLGMPVSTTHVLNSAVAGTMVANKSGLNFNTVKTILCMGIYSSCNNLLIRWFVLVILTVCIKAFKLKPLFTVAFYLFSF